MKSVNLRSLTMIILSFLMVIGLSACCTPEIVTKTHVIERNTIRAISIDNDLLQDCKLESPPDKVLYKTANRDQKESLLVNYSATLQKSIGECTIDKKAAREQIKRLEAQIDKYNAEEDKRIKALLIKGEGS